MSVNAQAIADRENPKARHLNLCLAKTGPISVTLFTTAPFEFEHTPL
jgi:hypothetical protein